MRGMNGIRNIVILTGAGISAESGLRTFRADDGLWEDHPVEEVATPQGFRRNPDLVVLAYGTNETGFTGRPLRRYRAEIDEALRRAKAVAPNASCLVIGPSDWQPGQGQGSYGASLEVQLPPLPGSAVPETPEN